MLQTYHIILSKTQLSHSARATHLTSPFSFSTHHNNSISYSKGFLWTYKTGEDTTKCINSIHNPFPESLIGSPWTRMFQTIHLSLQNNMPFIVSRISTNTKATSIGISSLLPTYYILSVSPSKFNTNDWFLPQIIKLATYSGNN